jgi:RNA polymerase primary sigma factor
MADRLLVDFIRSLSGRRRAPAAIARLPKLEQQIFRLIHWHGAAPEIGTLTSALARRVTPPPVSGDVAAGLDCVRRSLPADYDSSAPSSPRFVSLLQAPELSEDGSGTGPSAASLEDAAIKTETEGLLAAAASAMREVAATLPDAELLYLRIALSGAEPLPAREVARLVQRPVAEVYKLRQRVLKRLKDTLQDHDAIKNWQASV